MDTTKFEAAKSDEGRYRMLVEAVTDYAIYMLDPQGVVSSWNPAPDDSRAMSLPRSSATHFSNFYTEEDKAAGFPSARSKQPSAKESSRRRLAGPQGRHAFWAYVIIDPIRDDRRRSSIGFAKVTRDLTERREAERDLQRSEEQFRLLVQGVTDYAIYMLDPEGNVTSWNAGAQRIKGYAPEEIIGKHFSTILHGGGPRGRPAAAASRPRSAKAGSKGRAGASARTARDSGRTS